MEPDVFFGVTGHHVDIVDFREFVGIFFENGIYMLKDIMTIISFHVMADDEDEKLDSGTFNSLLGLVYSASTGGYKFGKRRRIPIRVYLFSN